MRSILSAALFAALSTSALAEVTLHDAVERAVTRNPDVQGLKARVEEARAREAAARSLTPAPPSAIFGVRRDNTLVDQQLGMSEYEAEIEVPFWLPGQRAAASASARAQEGSFRLGADAAGWSVAGIVRDQVWVIAMQAAEVAAAQRRVDTALSIEGDVAKRLKGGEVARGDLLQAQGEALAARTTLAEADMRHRQSLANWIALTGLDALPDRYEEAAVPDVDIDRHPRLLAVRASVAAARAEIEITNQFRRDPYPISSLLQSAKSSPSLVSFSDATGWSP